MGEKDFHKRAIFYFKKNNEPCTILIQKMI